MGDIWHWKSVRNVGQVDDQYLDSTQYSPDTPEAGRHGDPKDGGGYVNNESEDKSMPMWMGPEGWPRDGSPGYILDEDKQEFDDSLFAAGDMVAGITKRSSRATEAISPLVGDMRTVCGLSNWAVPLRQVPSSMCSSTIWRRDMILGLRFSTTPRSATPIRMVTTHWYSSRSR